MSRLSRKKTRRGRTREAEQAREAELRAVGKIADSLAERAVNAAEALENRRRRNHWGDTVASIAKGRRT